MSEGIYNPGTGFRTGSGFGHRPAPGHGGSTEHKGQDFRAGQGTPIPAAADGVVVNAYHSESYGNVVILKHDIRGETVYTLYAHQQELSPLKAGDHVKQGDVVGKVGSTGHSTGPHLHFEIMKAHPHPLSADNRAVAGHHVYSPVEFKFPQTLQQNHEAAHSPSSATHHEPHSASKAAPSTRQHVVPDETLRENQQMLIALGAKIKDDGLYGPKTEHALKGYQAFHGLKEDGQFNAETLAAMKADMQKQGIAKETPAQKPESEQLPKEVKERLDNAEKQVRELFTREGLSYDKQHGDKFALAAAQLGAEKGINPIEFIGVDRTSGHMIIGNKENGLLNTASMLTSDVGKVDQHTAVNAIQHNVQEQNQAQQQQKQEQMQQTQEHYQHKGAQR